MGPLKGQKIGKRQQTKQKWNKLSLGKKLLKNPKKTVVLISRLDVLNIFFNENFTLRLFSNKTNRSDQNSKY